MRIPVQLDARDDENGKKKDGKKSFYIIGVIIIAIIAIILTTYFLTLRIRRQRGPKRPKSKENQLPTLFNWRNIRLPGRSKPHAYATTPLQDNELDRSSTRDREMSSGALPDPERASINGAVGVDRNTSVRSVMTLPAYSPAARENERILGREGERAGIDTVVEFPETQDEEEGRREGEMESLYQIRLARRQEAREREERRQARREARLRGDMDALAEIRRRAEAAAEESRSQILIAEHTTANRERRVSSVQYGDLGLARHDGTRLRANSSESDNRPLLDSAASISGQSARSRALSTNTLQTHGGSHQRGLSVSSVVSSRASEDFEFPEAVHTRDASGGGGDDFFEVSLGHTRSRSASRGATPVLTPGFVEIPREQAPAYEDPPNYESPVSTRAPQLPQLERLPSIQVTTELTPVEERERGRSASPR